MTAHLLVLAFVAGAVVGLSHRAVGTRSTTLGHLSQKTSDLRDQRVVVSNVVSNVVGGVVHGRFLVVPSTVSSRHPVVFASSSDPFVVAESRTYRGYCFGVTFDPIPGIPVDPPFVYVLGVSPAP